VAGGIVIRADQHYEEVPSDFRKKLLAEAKQLGHTPSDVFEHILVGQSVYIDHGFDLVPGYRTVSIYAHLSHVKPEIKPGASVSAGQQIGLSGNSGTEPGTLGTRKGAHLHWELILQDAGGEYYLGQGWDTEKLYQELVRVFSE
jgi:murein DD-endopeptidase MepM/ murein hydrolase activator NlpD